MKFERRSGVLLHPTSLPESYGIGTIGKSAYKFIDWLEESKQSLWQVLPLGPTGYGDSPYASFSTFAGNPLACAAGMVVLETVADPDFLDRVNHAGDYIRGKIASWNLPIVKDVRGKGLMIGIQIDTKYKPFDIEVKCLEEGLCTTTAGSDVIRFLPPLVITYDEIDKGLEIFKKVLESLN